MFSWNYPSYFVMFYVNSNIIIQNTCNYNESIHSFYSSLHWLFFIKLPHPPEYWKWNLCLTNKSRKNHNQGCVKVVLYFALCLNFTRQKFRFFKQGKCKNKKPKTQALVFSWKEWTKKKRNILTKGMKKKALFAVETVLKCSSRSSLSFLSHKALSQVSHYLHLNFSITLKFLRTGINVHKTTFIMYIQEQ